MFPYLGRVAYNVLEFIGMMVLAVVALVFLAIALILEFLFQ